MATGGRSLSVDKGSDIYYEYACSSCAKDGKHVEACNHCMDCEQNLCSECLRFHDKFVGMKGHKILSKAAMLASEPQAAPSSSPLLTEKCKAHTGEIVNMYCGQHDHACCGAFIVIDHRLCQGVDYLPNVAKSFRPIKEIKDVKDSMKKVALELGKMKVLRQADLLRIGTEMTKSLEEIDEFRESIVKHLDSLVKKAKEEVHAEHSDLEKIINTNIKTLSETIEALENNLKRLDNLEEENEAQIFLSVKQGIRNTSEGSKLVQEMENCQGRGSLKYSLNSEIVNNFLNLRLIGDIDDAERHSEDKPLISAKLLGDFNVKVSGDEQTCEIVDVVQLQDKSVILSDSYNHALKRLDLTYKVVDRCTVPGIPSSMCNISPTEIAVALSDIKKVQFVSIKNKKSTCTRAIDVSVTCINVAFSSGLLFIISGGIAGQPSQIRVYSLSGKHLRTFLSQPGQTIFSKPCSVAVSLAGTRLHFADYEKGIVTTDINGKHYWTYTDKQLNNACGICVGDSDVLFVCGHLSHNILQVDSQGRKIGELLSRADGLEKPVRLCYDSHNQRLIVTMHKSNIIKVFKVVWK